MPNLRIWFFFAAILWTIPGQSQQLITEVIPLGYRSAAEIIPVLKPLVAPSGSVSGIYTTLVVKADADTLAAIKQILAELDRAPRNLMVTLRHGVSDNLHQSDVDSAFSISTDTSQSSVQVFDTRSSTDGQDVQKVRVLEGNQAFIRFGESVPLAQRALIVSGTAVSVQDSIQYQDVTSGFYVLPRLNGDYVVVHISPHRQNLSNFGGGVIDTQLADTTVSGRLGDWILLGGATNEETLDSSGTVYSTRSYESNTHSIYLRVDLLD